MHDERPKLALGRVRRVQASTTQDGKQEQRGGQRPRCPPAIRRGQRIRTRSHGSLATATLEPDESARSVRLAPAGIDGAGPVASLKNSDAGRRWREWGELLDCGGRAVHRRSTADTRCRPERQGCPLLPAHRAIYSRTRIDRVDTDDRWRRDHELSGHPQHLGAGTRVLRRHRRARPRNDWGRRSRTRR